MKKLTRKGIFYWFGYILPMDTLLRMVRDAGFDSVLLWWGDEFEELNGPKEKIAELARTVGLVPENAHLPYYTVDLLWSDDLSAQDAVHRYCELIDSAGASGIETLVFHPAIQNTVHDPNDRGLLRIEQIIRRAEARGITLAFENLERNEHLHYIFERVQSPALKLCYDSGHEHCQWVTDDILSLYGDRLAALHLHDNDGTDDMHLLPGQGGIDWRRVIGNIEATSYAGSLSLEVAKPYDPSVDDRSTAGAEAYLRRAVRSLDDALGVVINE